MSKPARLPYTPFRGTFTIVSDAYLELEKKHPHLARAAGEEYEAIRNKEQTKLPGLPRPRTIEIIKQEIRDLEYDIKDLEEELDDLKDELAAITSDPLETMPEEAIVLHALVKQYENVDLKALRPKPVEAQKTPPEAQLQLV